MIPDDVEIVTARLLYEIIDKNCHSSTPKQRIDFDRSGTRIEKRIPLVHDQFNDSYLIKRQVWSYRLTEPIAI